MAGSQRSLLELVAHLPPEVAATVLLTADGEVADAYRSAGLSVYLIDPGQRLNTYGKQADTWSALQKLDVIIRELLPLQLHLARLLRELEVDVVHANDPRASLLIGLAVRIVRVPLVTHVRGGGKAFPGPIWAFFQRMSHRIVTVSDAIQDDLNSVGRRKAITVYNGTKDVSGHGKAIPWLHTLSKAGVAIVCCMASVVPFKGHHHLLKATHLLNERGWKDRFVMICVGESECQYQDYREWLEHQRKQLGLCNLFYVGWQDDPFSFYRMSDIEVLPSVEEEEFSFDNQMIHVRGNEGFPRTHLEAMSFGLPIVGTSIAGVPEQIADGLNGFLVPPSDSHALADAIERLLKDPDLRRSMGNAGRQRVADRFTTEAYVAGVMGVYKSLLPRQLST